ncbi:unnamed protein product [Allacma fusca]|uniref:HBS1-like protein N-terminal domain-containing protein n=1 Tax=Allacma fusca TaxID=39272 RepID=A0A8J2KWA4_9HEXA|nr:unnamed protein product [Allacma fusca]
MSRHRNVRSMNYDDEYEGYDDVYGHSVEDDYGVSPSSSQYMYDRTKGHAMGSYLRPEDDIAEEPEDDGDTDTTKTRERLDSLTIDTALADLVPEEEILLKSCLEEIHNVVGDSIPEPVIVLSIIRSKFNTEKALDECLKGVTTSVSDEPKTSKNTRREPLGKDTPKIDDKSINTTDSIVYQKADTLLDDTNLNFKTANNMTDPLSTALRSSNSNKGSICSNGAANGANIGISLLDSLALSHLEKVDKIFASDSVPASNGSASEFKKPANLLFAPKTNSSFQDTDSNRSSSNLLFKNLTAQQLKGSSKGNSIFQKPNLLIDSLKSQTESLKISDDKTKINLVFNKKVHDINKLDNSSEENNPPLPQFNLPLTKNLLFQPAANSRNLLFGFKNSNGVESSLTHVVKADEKVVAKATLAPAAPATEGTRPKKSYRRKIQCFEYPDIFSKVEPGLVKRKPSFLGSRIAVPCDSRKKAKFFHYSTVWNILTSDCADRCFKFDTPSPDEQVRLAQLYNRPALGYQKPVTNSVTPAQLPMKIRPKIAMYDCSHHDF